MSREQFEAWAQSDDKFTVYRSTMPSRDYVSNLTESAWKAWQAATAAAYEDAAKVCLSQAGLYNSYGSMSEKSAAKELANDIRKRAKEVGE